MSSFGVEDDVSVHFVVPDKYINKDECSDDMKQAFQVCIDHSLSPSWLLGEDCLKKQPTKADVFVCEEFSGSSFGYLKSFSCISIIGPRCVLDCLAADIVIPKSKFPLFTLAMRDLCITTTGFAEPEKTLLGEKIQYMGGIYCPEFRQSVTHLVANHLCSAKYEKAVENNISVMTDQWVQSVWEASTKRNVHAKDEEFLKYKCPVFYKLVVTCSQIPRVQKENLKSNINNNGGEFSGELKAGITNVLVAAKPFGDKFTHANLWKIPCVTPEWVEDSISRQHALPFTNYALISIARKCSTPERTPARLFDVSASMIQPQTCHVNETLVDCTIAPKTPARNIGSRESAKTLESPKKDKHLQLINKINQKDVKKAGIFLDGCNIYLSGFSPEYSERLKKIINSGGATRFNEISDSVTHVIVGNFVPSDIGILKSQGARLHVVTVEWLVESIRLKCAAPEDKFSCLDDLPSPVEFQSPLSKKGLLALHSQNDKSVCQNDMDSPKHNSSPKRSLLPKVLFDQYSNSNVERTETSRSSAVGPEVSENDITMMTNKVAAISNPPENNKEMDGSEEKSCNLTPLCGTSGTQAEFFTGITFSISGYTTLHTKEIEKLITSCGGRVVPRRFKGIPDYGVVPIHGASLFHTATEIVTHLWLDDCAEEGIIVPVKYYHQPVNFLLDAKPLSGCVVTTTSYSGVELRFITELLEGLGAVNQSMMARINRPTDNLLATTHLICPADIDFTMSRKYKAACKWGIPTVSHQWLLSCAKEKKRVDEEAYLVSPDSHDSSVVIAKTPMTQATKRKFAEENTLSSRMEPPAATAHASGCAPASVLLQTANLPLSPSTPNNKTPKEIATPLLRTPRQVELRTPSTSAANTPDDQPYCTPRSPGDIPTPDTPYGRVFQENPSPKTRKMWKKWCDQWPEEPEFKAPPPKQRRNSTPMAELIHKCWQKFGHEPYMKSFHRNNDEDGCQIENADEEAVPSQTDNRCSKRSSKTDQNSNAQTNNASPTSGAGINTQLQELNQILDSASKASGGKRKDSDSDSLFTPHSARNVGRAPESLDLCTDLVEWIDPVISNQQAPAPVFMLTALENREQYEEIITSLGGIVCSPLVSTFEHTATHLVCQQPSRNEKILSSIAAGKWILEKRFLEDSKKEGRFLNEEDYEWGNPKADYLQNCVKPGSLNEQLAKAVYRWRCKIQDSGKKAFSGMKAIVCSTKDKSELYKRIIVAGGGEVLNISPPFSEPGNATVCILELAKVQHRVDLQTLVDKKVPCVAPLYLNDYLIVDPPPEIINCLIPEYKALQ